MTAETPAEPDFAPAPGHTHEVEYAVTHRIGRVRLNRPKALNSLTTDMCTSMLSQLRAWADDDAVGLVFIDGAGEKGLCAGGDVRALRETLLAGDHDAALHFWREEYALNALIADYPKPYVAWMDGVVMGGGVGVSSHGSVRLVTERAKVAMPETIIGLFPDVGGLYYLAHAPGELGTHVALTGLPFGPADAVVLGLADGVVAQSDKETVLADLAAGLEVKPQTAPASDLEAQRGWIDECYAGNDAATILRRLLEHDESAARAAGEVIATRSPHSVVVTLEAIRRAADMDVHQVLAQDTKLGAHFAAHHDFAEGVRALLVDKDHSPRWADASVADVDRAQVLDAFDK
ncbi:3-hydroxyisobutyryl-CoA hydrolase [Ornithinimicrobium sp. F0845]|uniref:3-hydroxyisobutyryl-CoA hydrolase n=1 Tax=Ornithinimicrobium sp. F0845 TaxID=2926412 RepID=UPI001FF33E0E|nr:3-hydroxyisobutyryl-CoA hydrolase [Ornithinimicrobium sp. F0845]MCK0112184.1 3-hydroxyisobutyryl-CoA hydrolase [Ornithinimicrobium sp. F0845]